MARELNLYKLTRNDVMTMPEYGAYDSCIVAAAREDEAISMHPSGEEEIEWDLGTWCEKENVICTKIGKADPNISAGVFMTSYNAG